MALIGYGRVSKRDQNPDSQRDQLTAAGADELFVDKASGAKPGSTEGLRDAGLGSGESPWALMGVV